MKLGSNEPGPTTYNTEGKLGLGKIVLSTKESARTVTFPKGKARSDFKESNLVHFPNPKANWIKHKRRQTGTWRIRRPDWLRHQFWSDAALKKSSGPDLHDEVHKGQFDADFKEKQQHILLEFHRNWRTQPNFWGFKGKEEAIRVSSEPRRGRKPQKIL